MKRENEEHVIACQATGNNLFIVCALGSQVYNVTLLFMLHVLVCICQPLYLRDNEENGLSYA